MIRTTGWVRGLAVAAVFVAALGGRCAAGAEGAKTMYFHDWHVLGPLANEDGKGMAKAYPPEKQVDLSGWFSGLDGKSITWRHTQGRNGGIYAEGPVDLAAVLGAKGAECAYAYTTVYSERDRRVNLLVGADGALAVWLSGKQVLLREGAAPAVADEQAVEVELHKGPNPVLVKTCMAQQGPWRLYFRLAPPAQEQARRYTLENGAVRLVFDHLGRPVEILNKATATALQAPPGPDGPKPAFIVDAYSRNRSVYLKDPLLSESGGFCTADAKLLLATEPAGDLLRLTAEPWRTPEITLAEAGAAAGGGQTLTCRYALAGGIEVTTTVTLPAKGEAAKWQVAVDNIGDVKPRQQLRVYRVLYPILPDLRVGERAEDNVLARTYVQGELIPNPSQYSFRRPGGGAQINVLTYPGWASMPWMDLYGPAAAAPQSPSAAPGGAPSAAVPPNSTGLYFASYDAAFQQVDIEAVPDAARKTVTLGMRTFAFLEPGEKWRSQVFVVAAHAGDWHWAADRYRTDCAAWQKKRDVPDWLMDSDGWFGTGVPNYRYSELPAILEDARWLGLNYIQCWSEMLENVGPNKARKAYYCFFLPDPDRGGEKEMAEGCRKVRQLGGHVGFYSNFWTWDADAGRCLQQWKDQIPADVKIPYWEEFRKYMSVFPDGHMESGDYYDGYAGSCPGAAGWRDYLKFWIADKYVKQYGVDAWYIDSFPVTMFGAARVCFSPYHAGGRPHGVGPGLVEFVRSLREATDPTVKLAITSESVGDAFMQYNSHALGLELIDGLTEYQSPQVYTYTFPHHVIFSGSCNGAGSGLKYYYKDLPGGKATRPETWDRVFLMGYRFDILGYKLDKSSPDMLYLRDLIALRQKIKAELYRSSFCDEQGLSPLPEGVYAKVFRHDEGKSVTVTLVDRRAKKDAMSVAVAPAALSVSGLTKATLFVLGGEPRDLKVASAADGKMTVEVPPRTAAPAAIVLQP